MIADNEKTKLSGYRLQKAWFSFALNNPDKINPTQAALYWFCIEHCNSLGWPMKFGLPASLAMAATGIKSYNTYIKTFRELVEFGFIELIEKSRNQYTANIIALSKFDEAVDRALDRALDEAVDRALDEPNVVYINNKQETTKPINNDINTGKTNVSQLAPQELFIGGSKDDFNVSGISIPFGEERPLKRKFEENNSSINTEEEKEKSCAKKEKEKVQFKKPTFEEVAAYCQERGNIVDAQQWLDYYTSNGWKVGKNTMKDWKAAVRTWERNGVTTYNNKSNGTIRYERRQGGYNNTNAGGPKKTEYKDSF